MSHAGEPRDTIHAAIAELSRAGMPPQAVSRLYASPAFPSGAGPDFVNAAVRVESSEPPDTILARLHGIEAAFGRRRDRRWGPRTLDLDLIAAGDVILPDAATLRHWIDLPPDRQAKEAPGRLILPHPRLQDRAFVLKPLHDIAPQWRHPLTRLTVTEMLASLDPAALAATVPLT